MLFRHRVIKIQSVADKNGDFDDRRKQGLNLFPWNKANVFFPALCLHDVVFPV